jgi:hypothetical protein
VDTPRTGVLAGFISEAELAAELGHTTRTLARWRALRIGPPFVLNGREVKYSVESARQWLANGGTAGASNRHQRRRKS